MVPSLLTGRTNPEWRFVYRQRSAKVQDLLSRINFRTDMGSIHAKRAKQLVEDPETYSEFESEYRDSWEYYRSVRNAAPDELPTFEEYLELHRIFFEGPSGDHVRRQVEQWLPRSVKNMVLGTSKRGRAYSVSTLKQVEERLNAYRSLDLETPTLYEQVQTIVEALYDDDWMSAYSTLDGLLAEVPEGAPKAIELVARLRAVVGIRDVSDRMVVEQEVTDYVSAVENPLSDAPSTAEACVREADRLPYDDERKIDLYAAAVQREPSRCELFAEYLYLSGREYVEMYRHRGTDPSRALLAVAHLQFSVLNEASWFEVDADQRAWITSYRDVGYGILVSGGRWGSDRENWPEPDFQAAAHAYASAAMKIRPVHNERYLKYVSKAFRHAAHEAYDWEVRQELHADAFTLLLELSTEIADEDTVATGQELARYHQLRRTEAAIHVAYDKEEYEQVVNEYHDFSELKDTVHRPVDSVDVTKKYDISKARLAETAGEYERARKLYNLADVEGADERATLCTLKEHLLNGEEDQVTECLDEFERSHPTVANAVSILSGDWPRRSGTDDEENEFLAESIETRQVLRALTQLSDSTEEAFLESETILEERLLEL